MATKNLQNPTNFFFNQSQNANEDYSVKIQEFQKQLINHKNCGLCKEDYNFNTRIPRILIHCGHTICTECMIKLYRDGRIRCPLCLKLIKHLNSVERLPVNHTIFTKMIDMINQQNRLRGEQEIDSRLALYQQFEAQQQVFQEQQQVQQQVQQQQQVVGPTLEIIQFQTSDMRIIRIDKQTGLEMCQIYPDRVKHFLVVNERKIACRAVIEQLYNTPDQVIVDLYDIEDIYSFLLEFFKDDLNNPDIEFLRYIIPQQNQQFNQEPQITQFDFSQNEYEGSLFNPIQQQN